MMNQIQTLKTSPPQVLTNFSPIQDGHFVVPKIYLQNLEDEKKKKKEEQRYNIKHIVIPVLVAGMGVLLINRGPKLLSYLGIKDWKPGSINNWTNLKDTWVKRFSYKYEWLKKAHDWCTEAWLEIGRNTVIKSYAHSTSEFEKSCNYMLKTNKRILTKHPGGEANRQINEIERHIRAVSRKINDNFGPGSAQRERRLSSMTKTTDEVADYFYITPTKKLLGDKKMYQSFIADDMIKDKRSVMNADFKTLTQTLDEAKKKVLEIYEGLLPGGKEGKEYKKIQAKMLAVDKSLKKSYDLETIKYFDMMRDLKLGSAPTDVLSVIASFATAIWCMIPCKDNDERISVSLQYGIPVVGAVATSLLCTMKLIAGGKAIAVGLVSGLAMHWIGEQIDKARKKYQPKMQQMKKALSEM